MITLFGHPASTYTRKVLCTLHELGQPYDLQVIDLMGGEQTRPSHLARQPFGRVPTIDDDGFALYESRAIMRYLNDRYGGRLVPSDVQTRAVMDQWMDVEYAYFAGAALVPILQHVFGFPQDDAALEAAQGTVERTLDLLDARLADEPHLAGEPFSLADIVYLPDLDYLMTTPLQSAVSSRGNVAAWWTRCSERPSWRKAVGR